MASKETKELLSDDPTLIRTVSSIRRSCRNKELFWFFIDRLSLIMIIILTINTSLSLVYNAFITAGIAMCGANILLLILYAIIVPSKYEKIYSQKKLACNRVLNNETIKNERDLAYRLIEDFELIHLDNKSEISLLLNFIEKS